MKIKLVTIIAIPILLFCAYIGKAQIPTKGQIVSYEKPLDSGLVYVSKLFPKEYINKNKNAEETRNFSFAISEFEKVFPGLIKYQTIKTKDGFAKSTFQKITTVKSINYDLLIPILVAAIQEQQEMILKQQQQIEALQKLYNK